MPSRLQFIVAYDGTTFAGWQSQAGGNAIQDHLERAFEQICSKKVRVHGAGRTNAGVHAIAQCAPVDLPARRYAPARWVAALNGVLPVAIRIMRCRFVSDTFHARFSAKGKMYRYRVWNAEVLSPFESNRAWHVITPLNLELLTSSARQFWGEHDFASFGANRGTPEASTVRIIRAVRVRRAGAGVTIEVEGDGFLYKMVRMMVGALVEIAAGKCSP